MTDVFYRSNSTGINAWKLLKIVIVVLMALLVGLLPAFRAFAAGVDVIVTSLLGTAVGVVLGEAGVAAIVAILIGMGVTISLQVLINLFNDESFQVDFTNAWQNTLPNGDIRTSGGKVMMGAIMFRALYDLIKEKIVGHFNETVAPDLGTNQALLNAKTITSNDVNNYNTYVNNLVIGSEKWCFYRDNGPLDVVIENSVTGWNCTFKVMKMLDRNQVIYTYKDNNYHLKFTSITTPDRFRYQYIAFCYPLVYDNGTYPALWITNGWADQHGNYEYGAWYNYKNYYRSYDYYTYFTQDDNNSVSNTDILIAAENVNISGFLRNQIYYNVNGVKHILNLKLADGTVKSWFYDYSEFLYYLLCCENELIDITDNVSVGNSIGAASTTVNNYYTESNDIYYNYANEISSAETAGTLAQGTDTDVQIKAETLTNSVAGTESLADVGVVTSVESAVTTTTGTTITMAPSVTCMTGINMIRGAAGNITTRFPFAVVYVLRDAFNIFLAEPVTPSFSIPMRFNIGQLVSIDEDFYVDLENLNTIAAIIRWGEAGALAIALAILTKRMLF